MPETAELFKRFADGDQDAFETVFRQSQGEVYRWILRIVRDSSAAEDLTMETFWRIYRARQRFDPARPDAPRHFFKGTERLRHNRQRPRFL